LQRARRLAVQERLAWPPRGHAAHKALMGQTMTMAEFADFDDVSILHCFKVWAAGDDPALAQLCGGLLYRRLFKVADISPITDPGRARDAMAAAEDAVARAGGDRSYDLFFDEPANTPYAGLDADQEGASPGAGIVVLDESGRARDFSEISPLVGALNRQLMFRRVHVAEEWRHVVIAAVQEVEK
jgi:hypothetical protein